MQLQATSSAKQLVDQIRISHASFLLNGKEKLIMDVLQTQTTDQKHGAPQKSIEMGITSRVKRSMGSAMRHVRSIRRLQNRMVRSIKLYDVDSHGFQLIADSQNVTKQFYGINAFKVAKTSALLSMIQFVEQMEKHTVIRAT